MKARQSRAGGPPPPSPATGWASSRPIQAQAEKPPVKPQNQPSLLSEVVPVLPAMSQPLICAWDPVPWATTSRSIRSISPSAGLPIT